VISLTDEALTGAALATAPIAVRYRIAEHLAAVVAGLAGMGDRS
jgi:hypothetical protein